MKTSKETSSNSNGFELNKEELEDKSQDEKSIDEEAQAQSTNIVEFQKSGFKLQLVEKLSEIDRRYKQGVLEYKENIQAYNIEIEKLKNEITFERESCDKEEKSLLMMEHEILFENKAYDKLQIKFSAYINSIEELKYEYKDVLDEVRYKSTLKRKEKELFELLDDLEVVELSLLNKELLRLNILKTLNPKQEELKNLELTLKELEMKKSYFESMGLHKVSNVQLENKSFWKDEDSEIVDTVEVENNK